MHLSCVFFKKHEDEEMRNFARTREGTLTFCHLYHTYIPVVLEYPGLLLIVDELVRAV